MILVTGATGFIGKPLVEGLIRKGYKVRVLSRDMGKGKRLFPKAEAFAGDLSNPESVEGVAKGVDTVVHLAGIVSYSKPKEELFRANVETTRNLLQQCGVVKKLVFSSSVSVYGEIKGTADEDYPLGPKNPYGESKVESEKLVRDSGIPFVALRIAPIYGKGSPSWAKNLRLLEKGFPIPKTKNLTHVVHISDVVQAFLKAVEKGEGVYNIADKKPMPFMDFAESLVRLLGKEPKKMPMLLVKMAAKAKGMGTYLDVLTMNRNYSIDKAEKDLGYRPKADFRKELEEMVGWYKGLKN